MSATPWRVPVVVLLSAGAILGLNMGIRQTFGLFLEPMTLDLGISRGNFSLAIAVQNLLWGLLTPFFGVIADKYGTARCLVFGGLVYALGILIMALGDSVLGLHLGAGVLVGIAVGASGFPLVLAAVARFFPPERRSTALGIAAAGGSVGQFILLPAAQFMIGGLGWVEALLILAAVSALIVPLAAALVGKAKAEPGDVITQTLSAAVAEAGRHRGFLLLTAGFFVCGFHVAFVATHLPAYITASSLPAIVGATALSLIGFFNIIGSLGAGLMGGRFRKKYVLAAIYLARAAAITLFLLAPKTEMAVWLFAGTFGFLWLSTVPLTGGLVSDIFGSRYMATLFSIVMLSHQIGAFFGAWLGGLSYDLTGSYDAVWIIAIALGLLSAALHWPIADAPVTRLAAEQA